MCLANSKHSPDATDRMEGPRTGTTTHNSTVLAGASREME